ncbi:hypothetical protein L345_06674, partial [Ophiophagus hannah]
PGGGRPTEPALSGRRQSVCCGCAEAASSAGQAAALGVAGV